MNNVKVSIIVPVYKTEKYISRCVESLRSQTLTEIEIILVDDGSPDNCPDICEQYVILDSRIKVVHQINAGLGLARNTGLNVASGKYVAFVDSDDYIDRLMMESLYNVAEKNHADVVRCGMNWVYSDNIKEKRDVYNQTVFNNKEAINSFILDFIGTLPNNSHDLSYFMSACQGLYLKQLVEDYNISFYSERIVSSEDTLFNVDFFLHSSCIVFVPDCYYYYERSNNTSITHIFNKRKIALIKCYLNILEEKLCTRFSDVDYFSRLNRRKLLELRNAISSICLQPYSQALCDVKEILNDVFWQKALLEYPFRLMPLKNRMFWWTIITKKYQLIVSIYKSRVLYLL